MSIGTREKILPKGYLYETRTIIPPINIGDEESPIYTNKAYIVYHVPTNSYYGVDPKTGSLIGPYRFSSEIPKKFLIPKKTE